MRSGVKFATFVTAIISLLLIITGTAVIYDITHCPEGKHFYDGLSISGHNPCHSQFAIPDLALQVRTTRSCCPFLKSSLMLILQYTCRFSSES